HQYLGDFFELLLNTGFKQESGQFFTPIPLTRFICKSLPIEKIINQKLQNEINFLPYVIDYASGSGHFITEMMDEIDFYVQKIKDDQIELGKRAIDKFERKSLKWAKRYIYAIEKDHRLVKISKVSSFLHGDGDANVILSNGLAPFSSEKYNLGEDRVLYSRDRNAAENNVFDIVVANPPYSVDNFAKESFKEYQKQGLKPENYFDLYQYLTSNSSEIECLFIERTKQLMKDGAVAGIVLPISILTNGGIYEKTREIILNHFNIKAIVSLGSNAFMATGTKTIILFLEKRPIGEFNETKKVVNEFLTHFKDVACGGFANAFSIYARNVYEMDFEDYISILQNKPTEKANTSEMMKEYKTLSHKEIIELEREKLIYFTTVYSQKIVLADSGEKDIEKEFYGYEFSNRRGHEGIHIYKDEEGKINSKLYNEDFAELEDKNKLNSYILRNFNYDKHLESEITEIQTSENHPLKNHIHFVRFSQLMSFDLKRFDKSVNLNKKNNLKIESKWELVKLGDEKLFKLYQPKTITSDEILRDGKYKVYGANGVIGFYNEYNHENSEIAITCRGATCGTINYTEPKSWITGNAMICQIIDKEKINQLYIKALLQNTNLKSTITGTAQPQITRETLSPFKLPLPPLEIQEKIVSEIGEIEKKEERVRGLIERNEQKINGLFGNAKNVKEITISEIAKSLTAGGDVPKESFSTKKTEKYQIPIYANGYQNKGLYGYTDIIKIDEPCITISARGTIGYSETRTEPFYPIVRLICLIPKEEIANIFYLKYLLNKTQFINSGTTTPQLTVPQISGIKLSLPPLSEQQKIIAQIEPLEKEVAEAKEFLASIKDLKNEVLMRYL
ncbi:MAG: hypothetical protein RL208_188, partial [Pseudomonadota bacterium]